MAYRYGEGVRRYHKQGKDGDEIQEGVLCADIKESRTLDRPRFTLLCKPMQRCQSSW